MKEKNARKSTVYIHHQLKIFKPRNYGVWRPKNPGVRGLKMSGVPGPPGFGEPRGGIPIAKPN